MAQLVQGGGPQTLEALAGVEHHLDQGFEPLRAAAPHHLQREQGAAPAGASPEARGAASPEPQLGVFGVVDPSQGQFMAPAAQGVVDPAAPATTEQVRVGIWLDPDAPQSAGDPADGRGLEAIAIAGAGLAGGFRGDARRPLPLLLLVQGAALFDRGAVRCGRGRDQTGRPTPRAMRLARSGRVAKASSSMLITQRRRVVAAAERLGASPRRRGIAQST